MLIQALKQELKFRCLHTQNMNIVKANGTGLDLLQSSVQVNTHAVGYNYWYQILTMGVHGAGELPALLTTDRRVKFRSEVVASICYLAQWVTCFPLADAVN